MVDGGHQVWVWQGWWPDENLEGEDFSTTGSAVLRFTFSRRAALQTALNYCKLKAKAQAKALAAKSYKKVLVERKMLANDPNWPWSTKEVHPFKNLKGFPSLLIVLFWV